jgi:hypothetical protein
MEAEKLGSFIKQKYVQYYKIQNVHDMQWFNKRMANNNGNKFT